MMTNKQMIFLTLIFNFAISGFAIAETNNSGNRVLNKKWWNGANKEYFSSVITGTIHPEHTLNNFPVVIKNRRGELKLAGTLGDYKEHRSNIDGRIKSKKLLHAITHNYGVNCDNRFLIVYSDQVSDCEKALKQFHKELESTEEGLEFLKNQHKQLTEFFAATMNDNNNNNEETPE